MKKNKILKEERCPQYPKNLYKNSEKEEIQRIIKLNSSKNKKSKNVKKIEVKIERKALILPKSKSREIKTEMSEEKKY